MHPVSQRGSLIVSTRRALRAVLGLALIGSLVPITSARAQTSYQVQIGASLNSPANAQSMRFFPNSLRLHPGDVIRFKSTGVHGATLLPEGTQPQAWLDANWAGTADPYSPALPDPDDGEGRYKLNSALVLPTSMDCGFPWQSPCSYGGSSVLHSGIALETNLDFSVSVNVPAGSDFWIVDLAAPRVRMHVEVVDGDDVTQQSQIDSQKTTQMAADAKIAANLIKKYSKPTKKVSRTGKVTWNAYAGLDAPTVSVAGFYPPTLNIKKGQAVKWSYGKLLHAGHSVTFPVEYGNQISQAFVRIHCDPDGDGTGGTDTVPLNGNPPYCDDASQLELELPDEVLNKIGDAKVTAADDIASSGVRGKSFVKRASAYKLKFPTKVAGGLSYVCVLHPSMTAKVVVK